MKNNIICESCNTENALYKLTCKNCGSYIRERVFNIDFWSMTWKLLESPIDSFKKIIFAEHKNFMFVILFVAGLKFSIDAIVLRQIFVIKPEEANYVFLNILMGLVYFIILIIISSLSIKFIDRIFDMDIRFKDNLAIYSYSFVPRVLVLFILFPVELALFGKYLFTFNPSPFGIKFTEALVIFGIEGLMLIWTLLLLIFASYARTRNILYSILTGLAIFGLLTAAALFLPVFPL